MLWFMHMKRGLLLSAVVLAAIIISGNFKQTSAAEANGAQAQGLQISPVLINLNADPGKIYTLKLSVLNTTTGDLVFKSSVNDFKAKDETGTPEILLSNPLPDSASLVSWVQPLGEIPLKSKQTKDLLVRVVVPPNAEAGGHYGVIRFSGTPPGQKQNSVSLAASAGTLLLVRVSGNINESLSFKQFFTASNGKQTGWFEHGPITFVERVTNNGNVHLAPQGTVTVKNMFGKKVADLKVNEKNGFILPNSTRRYEQNLDKKGMFGRYTASVNLTYGTHGQILTSSLSFWVIPWKIVLIIIVIIALLVFLITRLVKRYNRWILKKSR